MIYNLNYLVSSKKMSQIYQKQMSQDVIVSKRERKRKYGKLHLNEQEREEGEQHKDYDLLVLAVFVILLIAWPVLPETVSQQIQEASLQKVAMLACVLVIIGVIVIVVVVASVVARSSPGL